MTDILRRKVTFGAYFFEMPALASDTVGKKHFEFAVVYAPGLEAGRRADPRAFSEHFARFARRDDSL